MTITSSISNENFDIQYTGVVKEMDIIEFQEGVKKGDFTDLKGTAFLVINGLVQKNYNIYIDTQRVTKSGSIVSFKSLFDEYGSEQLSIQYHEKRLQMPDLETFRGLKSDT